MSDRYDRREFLGRAVRTTAGGLLIPGAAAAFLEACGNGSGGSSSVPSTPRRGGSLTFATEAEINSFDARQGAWDSTGQHWLKLQFSGEGHGMEVGADEGKRFEAPVMFRHDVATVLRPGSVVIVTPQSLSAGSTGREQMVIEEDAPAAPAAKASPSTP